MSALHNVMERFLEFFHSIHLLKLFVVIWTTLNTLHYSKSLQYCSELFLTPSSTLQRPIIWIPTILNQTITFVVFKKCWLIISMTNPTSRPVIRSVVYNRIFIVRNYFWTICFHVLLLRTCMLFFIIFNLSCF